MSEAANPTIVRADSQFLMRHPAHFVALGFGAGLAPKAPGTFGALLGWWLGRQALEHASTLGYAALLVAGFAIGVWACTIAGRNIGKADHGAIVWDEVIAMMLVVWFAPGGFVSQFIGFLLFRFFDIVKPPPIGYFDRTLKNGFGVMFDDLVAAGLTLIALALWVRW
jgi:phosphatidylglycerophosphatase A